MICTSPKKDEKIKENYYSFYSSSSMSYNASHIHTHRGFLSIIIYKYVALRCFVLFNDDDDDYIFFY